MNLIIISEIYKDVTKYIFINSDSCIDRDLEFKGICKIRTFRVDHTVLSYGIFLKILEVDYDKNNEFTVAYTGDTRILPRLMDIIGIDSLDILIHEATFSEDEIDNAIQRKHSVISEVISLHKNANIKLATIMTHFSSRYKLFPKGILDKLYEINYNTVCNGKILLALDNMVIWPSMECIYEHCLLLPNISRLSDYMQKHEDTVIPLLTKNISLNMQNSI